MKDQTTNKREIKDTAIMDIIEPRYFLESFVLALIVFLKCKRIDVAIISFTVLFMIFIALDYNNSPLSDSLRTYGGLYCLNIFFSDIIPKNDWNMIFK